MIKLSGWQRIGVALTILWLVLGSVGLHMRELRDANGAGNSMYSICTTMNKALPTPQDDPKDCEISRDMLRTMNLQGEFNRVLVEVLVPIPVFWLLGWLILKTIAWIRKGFKANQ